MLLSPPVRTILFKFEHGGGVVAVTQNRIGKRWVECIGWRPWHQSHARILDCIRFKHGANITGRLLLVAASYDRPEDSV